MKKENLLESAWLNQDLIHMVIMRWIWFLPHDLRRKAFKIIYPDLYWNLISFRKNRPPYDYSCFDKKECIFVHVPKAAGTSIYKHILNGHVTHLSITDYQIMYGRAIFDQYFKFSLVRNPWDRLVSAFFYLKFSGSDNDKKWAEIALARYDNFDSFVKDLPNTKFYETWIHFLPQYKFLADPSGKIPLDYIGKLENIDKEIDFICHRLNIDPVVLKKENISPNKKHYSDYYNKDTKKIVEHIYQEDIKFFNYTFDY